jgi:hypothetical protein
MNSIVEKYCVRVHCGHHTGSGVIIHGNNTFFVLTAAHCLGESEPNLCDIIIESQKDYQSDFTNISTVEVKEFNLEHDFALIEIDVDDEDELLSKHKLGRGFLTDSNVKFCGYQGVNIEEYRPFSGTILSVSANSGKFKISLSNDTFDQSGEPGQFLAEGLSGSGVFVFRHNSPFLVGILNSVITEKAWNDDINCCSVNFLEDYIDEYVDLSDFESLRKWNENIEMERTNREIEDFKKDKSDFFEKLDRKNKVLYPQVEKANKITASQIRKFLAMKENIRNLENDYPDLYLTFKEKVKRFVSQVENEYSRDVDNSNQAINLTMELRKELKNELSILPENTNIDLSEYQIIEWLGICTLNFTKNDSD